MPAVFKNPDLDFICFIALVTTLITALSFGAGLALARLFKCGRSDTLALVFSLGMSNTGTGMVLAGGALSDHPGVLLPMIFYTLMQQALAGLIYTNLSRSSGPPPAPASEPSEKPGLRQRLSLKRYFRDAIRFSVHF